MVDFPTLSDREKECLHLLSQGLRNQHIAERFGTSVKTVEKQIASARKKLGASTPAQAVAISVKHNLLK